MSGIRGSIATADRTPRLLHMARGQHGFWAWRNVAINMWLQPAQTEAVERLIGFTHDMIEKHPEGFSAVHYVPGGIALPSAEAREALTRLSSVSDGPIACVGVVLAGGGFWASTVRSALTGIQIVSRVEFAMRVSGSVDELVTWFPRSHAQKTGVATPPEQLASAIHFALNETG